MPMVPLPQSRPSSQIFAGCELTNPRAGKGSGAAAAGKSMLMANRLQMRGASGWLDFMGSIPWQRLPA